MRQDAASGDETALVDAARADPLERRKGREDHQKHSGRDIHKGVCRKMVSEGKDQVHEVAIVQLVVIRRRWR